MPSRSAHIRFDPLVHDFIARQAARTGVSFNDFVRGAALVRGALTFAAANPTDAERLLDLYRRADDVLGRFAVASADA